MVGEAVALPTIRPRRLFSSPGCKRPQIPMFRSRITAGIQIGNRTSHRGTTHRRRIESARLE